MALKCGRSKLCTDLPSTDTTFADNAYSMGDAFRVNVEEVPRRTGNAPGPFWLQRNTFATDLCKFSTFADIID